MKKTKIICTVGPSKYNVSLLSKMMNAGMDVARFNFSHGTHAEHAKRINFVREAASSINKPIALMADTRGPEMRLGIFDKNKIVLHTGDKFCLTTREVLGDNNIS